MITVWLPVLDIVILSVALYYFLRVIRGTYTIPVLTGLSLLMAATLVMHALHLNTCAWVLDHFWSAGLVLIAVIFQPELRAAFARLGSHPMGRLLSPRPLAFIDELMGALREAMQRQMGMLIVMEQEIDLQNYAETGTMINGDVSKELLLAIFNYRSPLHDGAAIIQADRLQAVGCLLPLSNDPNLAKILGTRHRAAVGLSEFTDAWVIVVSEETGSLSLARQGQLERDLTAEVLEERLRALYQARASEAVPA